MERLWYLWLLGLSAVLAFALFTFGSWAIVGLPLALVSLVVEVPEWAYNRIPLAGAIIFGPYLFARHYLLVPEATQQLRDNIRARTRNAD